VSSTNSKKPGAPEAGAAAERRRVGVIVHDERGNASVRWHDAPPDTKRPVLEILDSSSLSLEPENNHDPYSRKASRPSTGSTSTRTDLRKLSEWIKMMRELEARKQREADEEE